MLKEYLLDAEDEMIVDELDNLCGVVQNKETLKSMITFAKLKTSGKIHFGNYNLIIRSQTRTNVMNDLLRICSKVYLKYNIIPNDKICYLDKFINGKKENALDRIVGIEDSMIVINDSRTYIDYVSEYDTVKNIMQMFPNKVFIFVDNGWCEGDTDEKLGNLVSWKMTIEKTTLDDKIMYCRKILDENNLKYKYQDVK